VDAADMQTPVPADTSETDPMSSDAENSPEMEVYYTFTWGGRRLNQSGKGRGRQNDSGNKGKPRGKPKGKRGGNRPQKAQSFQSRPPKKDKIDPDNPFAAALMGLKDKT
jgi:ATP-dependent RNA helicase SUPV3L1/SUV3